MLTPKLSLATLIREVCRHPRNYQNYKFLDNLSLVGYSVRQQFMTS